MKTIKLILDPPPDGYEAEAELRCPVKGDWLLDANNNIIQSECDHFISFVVLTPKKPKRCLFEEVPTFAEAAMCMNDPYCRYCISSEDIFCIRYEDTREKVVWLKRIIA